MREVYRRLGMAHPSAHPLVKFLFEEMNRQRFGVLDMAERSGVNKNTLKDWRTRTVPTLDNLDAALGVLGWRLEARRS